MPSEWTELVRDAARTLDAAEREQKVRADEAREATIALDERFRDVALAYTSIATHFCRELVDHGLPGAETYTFYRSKEPFFGSRLKRIELVLIRGAGMSWYRAGESKMGPLSSYPRALAVGANFGPAIMAPFKTGEHIPYGVYRWARKPTEDVAGLEQMLADAREHNQAPEMLVDHLKESLAQWAAEHWRGMDLELP